MPGQVDLTSLVTSMEAHMRQIEFGLSEVRAGVDKAHKCMGVLREWKSQADRQLALALELEKEQL